MGTLRKSLTCHRFPHLADDCQAWRPALDTEALWVGLRLLCVAALWKAYCRRHHGNRTPLFTVIAGLNSRVRVFMASKPPLLPLTGPSPPTLGGVLF